jgi:hypothetical protein
LEFLLGDGWDTKLVQDRLGRTVKLYIPPKLIKFVAVKYTVKTGMSISALATSLMPWQLLC